MTSPRGVVNSANSSAPKTEPGGTPLSDLRVVSIALPTLTKHERPSRKEYSTVGRSIDAERVLQLSLEYGVVEGKSNAIFPEAPCDSKHPAFFLMATVMFTLFHPLFVEITN